MRLRTLPIAAMTVLFVGAGVLLASAPAGGQQPCLFSDCRPQGQEVTTTTTTAGIAATSSTTPGGATTSTTTSGGEVPTSTSTTSGGGPVGGPGAGPTTSTTTSTTTTVPELPRRAPTGGLPITGGDAIVLVLVGFGAVALGAGILRRS